MRLQKQCDARALSSIIWACGRLSSPATAKLLLPLLELTGTLQQADPQRSVDPRHLTVDLKAATSQEQLLQLVQQHAGDFNHIHLSAAYTQAVGLGKHGATAPQRTAVIVQQQLLSELHQLSVRLQQQCGARELANIIWSCGHLSSPATAKLLLPHFLQASNLQQAVPQEVSNVLWAAADLQLHLTTGQLQQLLGRFVAVVRAAKPQEVANTLWAVATMGQQMPVQQLQQLLGRFAAVLPDATPQGVSNTLWAVATLGQQVPPQQLQQLLGRFEAVLQAATTQALSNTMWAVAKLGQQVPTQQLRQFLGRFVAVLSDAAPQALSNTLWAVAAMGQQVPQQQLQRFLGRFAAVLPDATPQDVSNTLWAVATMGQQVPQQQLQRLLDRFVALLPNSSPQHVSNTLWAVATMGQQVPPRQLQLVLAAYDKLLPDATPQGVSNVLWACGKFLYVPQQLLQSLQQHPQQLQELITAAGPQELANIAWACGELGYKGQLLPGALLQQVERVLQDGGIGSFTSQGMCNLCWSAAVLDLQQCVPQVLQLAAAASQVFSTASDKGTQQLHQVHLWLLDSQLPTPGEGLSGVLTPQQLEQCRGSWEQQQTATAKQEASQLQQSVFAALLQLPSDTWQQQPQPEQPTADKACLIDIAAVTASGVKVAIEVEGPQHYVQPNRTLTGTTQSRNRALAARGYAVVSIPYWDWNEQRSTAQQQQHLLAKLQAVQQPHAVAAAQQPPPPAAAAAAESGTPEGGSRPCRVRRTRRVDPGKLRGSS